MNFRNDINGLRAIAVIAVVLFHFNPTWVPGGFAGVDVFFVVSGFLMTGIILRGLEQNNFSIMKFYIARANRIIPALAVLCLALLIFGWFYLTPIEYKLLSKHAASSVTFLSNIMYWREVGYFDTSAHEKWLLHTWSLSVEWQFYIIYPIILLLISKFFSIKAIRPILLFGTLIGFILCVIATYKWPNPSYYLLPTRAWEMMLGGIAYLYPLRLHENRKKILEWMGLFLIISSCFLISSENPWPGYLALFPVLGSFLLIQAHRNDSLITNNIIFQKIGTWSYSIYLWHWPLVVAIYIFKLPDYSIYLGLLGSVVLGYLSYKYIESFKFNNKFSNISSYFTCKPIYFSAIIMVIGIIIFFKNESITPLRFETDVSQIIAQEKQPGISNCSKDNNGKFPGCTYGEGPLKAIFIGDSHLQAQNTAIGNRVKLLGGSIKSWSLSGCPTIKNVYTVDANGLNPIDTCGKMVNHVLNTASKEYPGIPVVIINRTSSYLYGPNENKDFHLQSPRHFIDKKFTHLNEDFRGNFKMHMINTICEFSKTNPVYLVRPTPEMKQYVSHYMLRALLLDKDQKNLSITQEEYNNRHNLAIKIQDEARARCNATILDATHYFCNGVSCNGDKNNIPLYYDDDHLSQYGSKLISPIYDEVFN